MSIIKQIEDDALAATMKDIEIKIGKIVPKRTGQLRESLIANLKSSRRNGMVVRLILGTHLNYAPYVAAMSTNQVKHHGEDGYAYYNGNYGHILLDDPEAETDFLNKLLGYAYTRMTLHLQTAINKYGNAININKQQLSKLIGV